MTTDEFIRRCELVLKYDLDETTKDFYMTALKLAKQQREEGGRKR